MKLKRGLVVTIISIIILTMSTNSFAMSLRDKMREDAKKSSNTVSNSVTNEASNKVSNKTSNRVDNKVSNKVENKVENEVEEPDYEEEYTVITRKEVRNKDLAVIEATKDVEFENLKVNGNVYIASTNEITLDNMDVNGDVMLFTSDKVVIKDSDISGSVYIASTTTNIKNSQLLSVYTVGEEITIDSNTSIERDLKTINEVINFDGRVERDYFAIGAKIVVGDNARIDGKTIVRTEDKEISKRAEINDLDYEEITYTKTNHEDENNGNIITYLISEGTGIAIILLITIFVLCCFPKFVKVNSNLRLRSFFTDFLLGIIMCLITAAIAIGLFATGYGAGYGFVLLNLLFLFLMLGKVLFTISFAIRLCCDSQRISRVKAFFGTVIVALALSAIGMISLAGNVGLIIEAVIELILAFTGFGAMFNVLFSSKKRYETVIVKPEPPKPEPPKPETEVEVEAAPVATPVPPVAPEKDEKAMKDEIKAEIKKELKEEAKKEARKIENQKRNETKKFENQNHNNNKPKDEKPKENKPKEEKKPENQEKKSENNKGKKEQ